MCPPVGDRIVNVLVACAGIWEKQLIWAQKVEVAQELFPPWPSDENNFAIHAAKSSVRNANPTPWPAHTTVPLSGAPKQYSHDDSGYECQLLAHVDDPVDAASHAAVLARAQEHGIAKVGNPEDQDGQDKSVLAAASAESQVLRAHGGFEDEEIEVDLRRRGREQRGWVLKASGRFIMLTGGLGDLGRGDRGRRRAFDDLVELGLGHLSS